MKMFNAYMDENLHVEQEKNVSFRCCRTPHKSNSLLMSEINCNISQEIRKSNKRSEIRFGKNANQLLKEDDQGREDATTDI